MRTLQANSHSCFVCGLSNPYGLQLRFYTTGEGEVTADYTVPEHFQGYPGVVHGGIAAAMLDEAAGRSLMGSGSTPDNAGAPDGTGPRFMYTARLDIRYRKNVPVGQPLRLVGRATKSKQRTAAAVSQILDTQGNVLAEADVLLVDVPDDMLKGVDLEALGWKVYAD